VPVSTRSVWDEHLAIRGILPVYTLNRVNYDAMAEVLIPRAVGYSAGMLDYFFRGRVTAYVEEQNQVLGLRITNQTPDEVLGPGRATLYYILGPEEGRVPLAQWDVTLGSGQQTAFLAFPNPPAAFRGYLLVYRGNLGLETDAIVAQEVDPFPGAYSVYIGNGREGNTPGENEYEWGYAVPWTTPVVDMDVSTWWAKYRLSESYSMGRYNLNIYRALIDSPGDRRYRRQTDLPGRRGRPPRSARRRSAPRPAWRRAGRRGHRHVGELPAGPGGRVRALDPPDDAARRLRLDRDQADHAKAAPLV
jgi:hypothetical protein